MKYLRYMVASSLYLTFIGCLLLGITSLQTESKFIDGVMYFILAFIALAVGDRVMREYKD